MRGLKVPLLIIIPLSILFGLVWGIQLYQQRVKYNARLKNEVSVRVLAHRGVLPAQVIQAFEEEAGIQVLLTETNSPEELWDKIETQVPGQPAYDLVSLMSYQIPLATQLVRIQPLSAKMMKNLGRISPDFRRIPGDLNHEHLVPLLWGLTGLAYDSTRIEQPVDSWREVIQTNKKKSRVGILASTVDIVRLLGQGAPNEDSPEHDHQHDQEHEEEHETAKSFELLRKPVTKLLDQVTLSRDFLSPTSLILEAGSETPAIVQINHGETAFAPFNLPQWKFVFPREKASFWILSLALTRDAQAVTEAHRLLDFLLEKDSALALTEATRQASTNRLTEETSLDSRLKPSYFRQVSLTSYSPLRDFSRSREMRALISPVQAEQQRLEQKLEAIDKPAAKSADKSIEVPQAAQKPKATAKATPQPTPQPKPKPRVVQPPKAQPAEESGDETEEPASEPAPSESGGSEE